MRELKRQSPFPALLLTSGIILVSEACASPGIPPGGPVDTTAPKIVSVAPDSGRVAVKPREILFRFDEVVSERPAGAPSLEGLFLISPRDGTPNVSWHRSSVSVRPHRGWRPNTAYTITMLPGMSDLRGNVRNTGAVVIFSTGPTIPNSTLSGIVFNWLTGALAPRAFVEARPTTDTSTVFVTVADSTGAFLLPTMAPGQYRVRAILDGNNNKGLDPREEWDTATVALTNSARVELYPFPHDSVGARLASIGLRDSVTLELVFDHPIDVNQHFAPASVSIKTSDSASIPIVSITKPELLRDTTAAVGPRPSRPIPSNSLLVGIGTPIRQKTTVRVRTMEVRGLDGVAFTSDRVEALTPAPPPPPPGAPPPPPAAGPIKR